MGRVRPGLWGDLGQAAHPPLLNLPFSFTPLSHTPGTSRRRTGRVLHEEIRQVICGRDVRAWCWAGVGLGACVLRRVGDAPFLPDCPLSRVYGGSDELSDDITLSSSCSQESSKRVGQRA